MEVMKLAEAIKRCRRRIDILKLNYAITNEDLEAIETVLEKLESNDKKIEKILDIVFGYGQIDGDHHKAWVIDQIVRILQGNNYKKWVYDYEHDKETGDTYTWETGIAP